MAIENKYLKRGRKAHQDAFKFLSKTRSRPDPDVEFYQSLTDRDFKVLVSKYGLSRTTDYIEDMEKMMMKEGI